MHDETEVMTQEVEEPEADKFYYCGVDLNKYKGVTEEEVKSYFDYLQGLTKIELIRTIRTISENLKTITVVKGFAAVAKSNMEMASGMTTTITGLNDGQQLTEYKSEDGKSLEQEDFSEDITKLEAYEVQLECAMELAHLRYEDLKVNGTTTIAEDIVETLLKNRATLEGSESNLNAELYIKYIDSVIDELQSHSVKRMFPKLENEKKNLNLCKEFFRNVDRSLKEIMRSGFSITWAKTFADFMREEQAWECDEDNRPHLTKYEYTLTALIFFYHISKIANTEVKKHNYLSLIFKYYVLQILELETTTRMPEDKRVDEVGNENEVSKMRQDVFKEYYSLMSAYYLGYTRMCRIKLLKDDRGLKAAISRIINPPRKKTQAEKEEPRERGYMGHAGDAGLEPPPVD